MNPKLKKEKYFGFGEKTGEIFPINCFNYPDIYARLKAKLVIYSINKNCIR
jgi:hypothetical protein